MTRTQIVWFKRDLRVTDHLPLLQATRSGATIAIYCFEPSVMNAPTYAAQHAGFAKECLTELQEQLAALNIPLFIFRAEVIPVLRALQLQLGPIDLHSHEETGEAITYQRDLAVKQFCKEAGITWRETPSHAVVRKLVNRDHWSSIWDTRMSGTLIEKPVPQVQSHLLSLTTLRPDLIDGYQPNAATVQWHDLALIDPVDKAKRQRGGRSQALSLLHSFLDERAVDYKREMSSPLTAAHSCSRLSPFIAMGVVSVREVLHHLWHARKQLIASGSATIEPARVPSLLASLKSFESRLHWRCHFVQKLESQPSIEWRNQHSAYDHLRQEPISPSHFNAWATGTTGFPMIDACMRMLLATGWVNFRMRAMLVSFASYQLWMHWHPTSLHLARQFLDYEPGIHYSQHQMQSGTTGINIIRMYNPVKQARDQDPDGAFVRRWIPALAAVPQKFIFEPWTMPLMVQQEVNCVVGTDYPAPIIDLKIASQFARDQVWSVRDQQPFAGEAKAIYQKLGSRNPHRLGAAKQSKTRRKAPLEGPASPQLDLF